MVKPNPNSRPAFRLSFRQRHHDTLNVLMGMILGAVLMVWMLAPRIRWDDCVESIPTTKTEIAAATTTTTITSASDQGKDAAWHPIHIFYGDRLDLPNSTGPWFAQAQQDQIVIDLLGENGYFIDLASNDASDLSNTLALERHGWTGLCVEPNPLYWYGLSHRNCTVIGALMGGTIERVQVKFRGVYGGILGTMNEHEADRHKEPDAIPEWRYTARLTNVLERFHVPPIIDYLSLDVEGAEMLIMKEFPFDKYTIKVMSVERPKNDLRLLLKSKGYILLKKLTWWGETLWAHESTGLSPDHPKIQKIVFAGRN